MASLMIMSEPSSLLPITQRSPIRPVPTSRRTGASTAAVDFSAYLLSASPPGFGVLGCLSPDRRPRIQVEDVDIQPSAPRWKWAGPATAPGGIGAPSPWSSCRQEFAAVVDCPSSPTSSSSSDDDDAETSSSADSTAAANLAAAAVAIGRSALARRRKSSGLTKKVSFADDLGQLLEQIRVFSESSDTPPNISPRIIRRHNSVDSLAPKSASPSPLNGIRRRISPPVMQSSPFFRSPDAPVGSSCASHFPAVKPQPNFAMPVADRSSYLDRIDRQCVSLESIGSPSEDLSSARCARCGCPSSPDASASRRLIGSIGVKNIAFEKSVVVRCSFNGWLTYNDVHAMYARSERAERGSGGGAPSETLCFDVFEFSVNLPLAQLQRAVATSRGRLRVQLAVCYEAGGRKFWDNNDGHNYELIVNVDSSPSFSGAAVDRNTTDAVVFGRQSASARWTEFSGWNAVDETCPYW